MDFEDWEKYLRKIITNVMMLITCKQANYLTSFLVGVLSLNEVTI